jgi:hypothetical protein
MLVDSGALIAVSRGPSHETKWSAVVDDAL